MSAETFTTAMFLITAVIAAGVLINAVFPVVYQMAGTFASATHESDQRIRTDIKILTTYASGQNLKVWLKNIGSERVPMDQITYSDVVCGPSGNYNALSYTTGVPAAGQWTATQINNPNSNTYWDKGETILVTAKISQTLVSGDNVYFQFVLPNGVSRSVEFTAE
jgi:flagellar protein FlaG